MSITESDEPICAAFDAVIISIMLTLLEYANSFEFIILC